MKKKTWIGRRNLVGITMRERGKSKIEKIEQMDKQT
jgi:hypothetical protein